MNVLQMRIQQLDKVCRLHAREQRLSFLMRVTLATMAIVAVAEVIGFFTSLTTLTFWAFVVLLVLCALYGILWVFWEGAIERQANELIACSGEWDSGELDQFIRVLNDRGITESWRGYARMMTELF